MERIPIAGPSISDREIRYVTDAVSRGWYEHATEYVDRLERAFAEYLGVSYAVALPSCTSAIHLALLAAGIGPGDEVLVPDITWIASSAPISYVGANPCFVDIDPVSWCVSATAANEVVNPRSKALIAVDLYGNVPDWDAVRSFCDRQQLFLIEDAAEAIGTRWRGRPAGSFGDVGVFSFHGSKTMTTGEGGMLVTNSRDLWERVQVLRDHGRQPADRSFFNAEVAYKYKMGNLAAALGLAQLERIDELVALKQTIMAWYREEFEGDPRVTLNPDLPGVDNSYWMTTLLVAPESGLTKETVIAQLAQRKIDSRPFFHPLSSLPAYAGTEPARAAQLRNHHARSIAPYGVNLPSALNLTREQVARVGSAVRDILDSTTRDKRREAA